MTISLDSKPLFSFGSLMDCDVLTCVSGQPLSELSIVAGTASGYVQRAVMDQSFPVLVSSTSALTTGVLISGLTDIAMDRILFFEGDEYELADITVETSNGEAVPCRYFQDTAVYEVSDHSWDFLHWQATEKAEFLVRTKRFMRLFGTMSATDADVFW